MQLISVARDVRFSGYTFGQSRTSRMDLALALIPPIIVVVVLHRMSNDDQKCQAVVAPSVTLFLVESLCFAATTTTSVYLKIISHTKMPVHQTDPLCMETDSCLRFLGLLNPLINAVLLSIYAML